MHPYVVLEILTNTKTWNHSHNTNWMPADTYGSLPKQLDHAASMVINSYKANSQKRCKPYLELNLVHVFQKSLLVY